MNKDRLAQIEALFHQALSYAPDARVAYLQEACAGDEDLRREVEALLAYEHPTDSFIEKPAFAIAARALVADENEPPPRSLSNALCPKRSTQMPLAIKA